jgi:hypothetical protein
MLGKNSFFTRTPPFIGNLKFSPILEEGCEDGMNAG